MIFRVPLILSTVLAAFAAPAFAVPVAEASVALSKRAISQSLYDDFVRYTQYSSATHLSSCPRPLGGTRVLQIDEKSTNTQGFVSRDDSRKEIVVAFRGSTHPLDFIIDLVFALVPFEPTAVPASFAPTAKDTRVHAGFLIAHNSVAQSVVNAVSAQVRANPTYSIVTTGHSLGAALASLFAVTLKANFPNTPMKVYTFGQPRTGDRSYADLIDRLVGQQNIYRAVHTTDLVTYIPSQELGYRHHGTEYWQSKDPANAANVRQCSGQEDMSCSAGNPGGIIESALAHVVYFGIAIGVLPFGLC